MILVAQKHLSVFLSHFFLLRAAALYRVAFADFSTAPWQGFEKSERCPNSSSLFLPQAAVVAVANPAAKIKKDQYTNVWR